MKKILSCVMAFLAAVSLYATDLNIYASGLKVTTSGGSTVGIQYTLNAPATSLDLKILDGSTLVTTIAIPAGDANVNFTKGTHNVNIDITDLAEGSYNWAIVANAAANGLSELAEVEYPNTVDAYRYYLPQDIVVDNSFESQYFGRVYVSQSTVGDADGDGGSATTKNQTRGLYIYNADLTFANGQEAALTGYDGNIGGNMTGSASRISFKRLAIDGQGYVYVASRDAANKGVYRMDPANPQANFQTVLSNGHTVEAIGIVGNNLYTLENLSTTAPGGAFNTYSLAVPVSEPTTTHEVLNSYTLVVGDCDIASDGRGGWWASQNRWNKDTYACLVHFNSNGVKDFAISQAENAGLITQSHNASYRGVVAVNPSGTLVAMGSDKRAVVFAVTYDALTGVPSLGDARVYQTPVIGGNIDGLAFDMADNFYVASASAERFYAYATPKAVNSFETPAPSANMIVRSSAVTHVTGISLDQTSASIEKGHTLTLVPTITPDDASNPTIIWTSANSDIASVSNSGVVTAVAEGGPITITATTQDGGLTATCDVTVYMNHVTSVMVEPSEITLGVGFKQQLTATILPADATNKTYAWSSDDEAIATVANGLVTAVAVGTTTIKATAEDGDIIGSCTVNVTPAVAHIGAYGLSVVKNANDYTFSFNATMAATSGALEFYNKAGDKVGEIALAGVEAGANQKTVAFAELPGDPAQELTWAVRLSAADNAAFSKIYQAEAIAGRSHLAVDANPESPFFGQIYQFNRTAAAATSGLYIYDQADQDYNRSAIHKMGDNVVQGIMRLTVSADGTVWGIDYSDGHSGVYVIDPADLDTYSQFYVGTRASSGLFTNGGQEVGGSGTGIFAYGSGEDLKIYTIQEDMTGAGANPMAVYNVGTARTWDTAPSQLFTLTGNANGIGSIYVVEEGIWVSQNRSKGNNTLVNPGLTFYAMDGTALVNFGGFVDLDGCNGAGMTVDPKHNKMYIIDGSTNICEFDIEYNAETNVPTLTLVNKHYTGYTYISSMGMDYAGNLYVTAGNKYSNSGSMAMVVFSPATHGDNTTITPAPKAATVSTPDVETLYMIGVDNWNATVGTAMEKVSDNVFRCQVDFNATKYFAFSTVLANNNDDGGWAYVNAHRYAGTIADATLVAGNEMDLVYGVDRSMQMAAGKYNITVDLNTMKVSAIAVVDQLYEIGNNQGWDLVNKVEMTKVENNVFEAELTFTDALSYFAFTTSTSTDWAVVNSNRFASDVYQERVDDGSEVNLLAGDGDASLTVLPGVYTVRVNFNTNKVTVTQSVAKVIVSNAGYATYYNSAKAYTMPVGMTGYAFNAANGLVEAYTAGTIVPADFPLVLAAAAGTYDLVFTEGGTPVDLASQLLGTDADAVTTAPTAGEYKFYGLSLDTDNSVESVGFYYMEEDGAAFTNGAHKAYLAVPVAAGVAPRYIFHGENNATGVENIEANEQAVKFIENGKLYIRKNGVVYDAKGAVVR